MTLVPTHELLGTSLLGNTDLDGSGAAFQATDPATGAALEPVYHNATAADVDRAAALAWDAFEPYRHTSLEQRGAFLDSIADEIEALGPTLTERVHAETGIPLVRVQGETARTTGQLRMFAAVVRDGAWTHARLDAADPDRTPLPKPDLRQREVPLGPVVVFAASNFPLAFSVAGGDTASALAAGAPVIVKAHSAHPGTSELVGRAVRTAVQKPRTARGHLLAALRIRPRSRHRPGHRSADPCSRLHRVTPRRSGAGRGRGGPTRSHPGLRRDVQH